MCIYFFNRARFVLMMFCAPCRFLQMKTLRKSNSKKWLTNSNPRLEKNENEQRTWRVKPKIGLYLANLKAKWCSSIMQCAPMTILVYYENGRDFESSTSGIHDEDMSLEVKCSRNIYFLEASDLCLNTFSESIWTHSLAFHSPNLKIIFEIH